MKRLQAVNNLLSQRVLAIDKDYLRGMIATSQHGMAQYESVGESVDNQLTTVSKIGVIPIFGCIDSHLDPVDVMLGGCDLLTIQAQAKQYMADDSISQVVLYVVSTGGSVIGLPETYGVLKQLAAVKPLTAYTDKIMAFAALYLACAANSIYASPSSYVGSAGIIQIILDDSELNKQMGLNYQVIKAGEFKDIGLFKPLSKEELTMLQADVDAIDKVFESVILAKAPNLLDRDNVLNAKTYTGEQAANINLVDGTLDTFDDFISFISQ